MILNYLKIAFRNLLKFKAYSFINISGLAIGIACCSLILLYVQKEISYDNYHQDLDQLHRLSIRKGVSTINQGQASVSYLTGENMVKDYPEVEQAARMLKLRQDPLITLGDRNFSEKRFFFAESTLFDILTIPFLKGDPETALTEPNSVVISGEIATKYFGRIDVTGESVKINFNGIISEFKITGVLQNAPQNTHFKYDLLAELESAEQFIPNRRFIKTWFVYPYWTYLKLTKDADAKLLEAKFPDFIRRYFPETRQDNALFLQPVRDIHLHSQLENEFEANNDILYIYIFSAIAILVLIIACINFMNLATARSINRAKEVGMRKVLGAQRHQLIRQFLTESVLTSMIAVLFSLGLIEIFLLIFNKLSSFTLDFNYLQNGLLIAGFFGLTLFVGLAAGIYPAMFLSGFQPIKTLKGIFGKTASGQGLRRALVVVQMCITVILLVSIIIINQQLDYVHDKKLGFTEDQMLLIEPVGTVLTGQESYESFKNQLMQLPEIQGVTRNSRTPGQDHPIRSIFPRGVVSDDEKMITPFVFVDYDYASVYDLEFSEGRDFSLEYGADNDFAYILTESAVKALGLTDPLGKEIATGDLIPRKGPVVGIVKDFHYASLHQEIDPLIIGKIDAFGYRYISVRIQSKSLSQTVAKIEGVWRQFEAVRPMTFSFLDDRLNKVYQFEAQLGNIITYFTVLAILIASLGLFGMASFAAEQRVREIGIRKVLGASVSSIILSFTGEFVKLALIAAVIASPIAWYAMDQWLNDFAYRVSIDIFPFLISGFLVLLIALLTVSYQATRAALINPVESLKYE